MQKIQSFLAATVLVTGISHLFCCGLPFIFSILSVLAGLGFVSVLPVGLENIHEMLHVWEIPLLFTSGIILFVGWGLHIISEKLDCRKTGCDHPPCEPKKKRSSRILVIATILFCINVSIVFLHSEPEAGHGSHHQETNRHY